MVSTRTSLCISALSACALGLLWLYTSREDEQAATLTVTWGRGAAAVVVLGEWDGWKKATRLSHTRGILHAATIKLPEECPRRQRIGAHVCCYRYAYKLGLTPSLARTRRSLVHDPRQPVDVHDESGRTVNVACVSVSRPSVHSAPPLASPPRAAAQAAANSTSAIGRARPRDEPAPCTKLSSSRWEVPSGGALQPSPLAPGSRGGRSWDECCDACVAAGSGCGGFNWAARHGCALFALHAIDDLHTTLFATAGVRREAVPRVSEALVGLARRSRPKAKPTTALAPRRDPV